MSVLDYRSGIDERAERSGVFSWIGWAIYLGMSWTWCIGMFLPVLMIIQFGAWGWWVFAIPNVLGAAAMGWTIDAEQSRRLVDQHSHAVNAFAFVTATFQIFFALWVFEAMNIDSGFAWIMLILAVVTFVISRSGSLPPRLFAMGALVVSLGCAVWAKHSGMLLGPESKNFSPALLSLAPVCVFGFLLCPYLDPTFHLARQHTPRAGARVAFGAGFGLFFLAMIVFTYFYSSVVGYFLVRAQRDLRPISVHWVAQLALTTGLHWHAPVLKARTGKWDAGWLRLVFSSVIALALALLVDRSESPSRWGDLIYLLFMAFYGLVFPAYVWLCMIPSWRDPAKPSSRLLTVFAGSVILASPFYWLGFIEGKLGWLGVGLGIVLLARLLIRRPVPLAASQA